MLNLILFIFFSGGIGYMVSIKRFGFATFGFCCLLIMLFTCIVERLP